MNSAGTILVVDDNETVLETTKLVLESAGHVVITTTSVFCSPLIAQHHPDVILMDVTMPGLAGDAASRALSKVPALLAGSLIILYSNLSAEELRAKVSQCGATGYLQKCSDPAVLIAGVDAWVQRARGKA